METEIKKILDRVRTSKLPAGWQKEWRVSVGEHNGTWVASLLSYDVLEGSYRLVQEGDPEPTCIKALARLDRRVELLVYTQENGKAAQEHAVKVAWDALQKVVAVYGADSKRATAYRNRWRVAVSKVSLYDATGATEKL